MTEITINRTCAILDRCEQFTSGRVGARIKFSFSPEWAGLNKTAVFTNGDTTIDVLNVTDECVIPHEVLAISGKKLKVGVYGFTADDDGNIEIAIPTVYAELGKVVKGADPSGDESTEPSLPVWAQIQSDVSDLDDRIDGITQPTKVSQLENDAGYITAEDLPDIPSLDDYAKKQYVDDAATEIKEDLDSLDGRVTYLEEHGTGGGIPDAPADGKQYARKDGAWSEVQSGTSYDDTAIKARVSAIEAKESGWDAKQDAITDLATIRSGAALGATALQSVPNTYALKTDIPQNVSAFTNDSGYLTQHQSLAAYRTAAAQDIIDATKQDTIADLTSIRSGAALGATAVQPEAGKGLFSGSYTDLTNKPTIPSAVTESTVSGWGFTKNTGTYSKPSGGIPKTDLASAVQTSLGKADTALQQHQDISGKENTSNKVTTISSASTNTQYPSAKAVYDFIASLDGNGVAY